MHDYSYIIQNLFVNFHWKVLEEKREDEEGFWKIQW